MVTVVCADAGEATAVIAAAASREQTNRPPDWADTRPRMKPPRNKVEVGSSARRYWRKLRFGHRLGSRVSRSHRARAKPTFRSAESLSESVGLRRGTAASQW